MAKSLLFITRSRLDANDGGSNASKGFVCCFAQLFDICSIIYPAFNSPENIIPSKYKLFPYHDKRNKLRKGLDVYRGLICADAPFVKEHLAHNHYDVIIIDNSFAGASLIPVISQSQAKLITIHHNVEQDYLRDNAKQYSVLFRYPYLYFAKKAEHDCLLGSNINLTLTAKDAATFSSWYEDKDLHLHRWGVFEYKPIEGKQFKPKEKGLTFAITGSLYFMQSLHPILNFIRCYWPLVLQKYPTAKLVIAGRNPAQTLQDVCSDHREITLIPNPKDIAAVVRTADYYICPINVGSGLKLRLLDGLRQGLPVLCHEVSTSGYEDLVRNKCVFSYNNENNFSDVLRDMIESKKSPDDIYQAFRHTFSLANGIERLRKILTNENII